MNFDLTDEIRIMQEASTERIFYVFVWSEQRLRGGNSKQALNNYLQRE